MRPPQRLLDDAALPRALRDDLTRTRALPYGYDARLGLAALQAALAVPAVPAAAAASAAAGPAVSAASGQAAASASGAPAAAASTSAAASAGVGAAGALLGSAGANLGIASAVAALVAAGVLVLAERGAPQRAPHATAQTHARAGGDRLLPADPLARVVTSAPARGPSPEHETIARASAAAAAAAPPAQPPALRREIAQLGRIKALLARDPARAYQLAQQGHRRFARGLLHHEREGLAVLALFELGRREQAERRARAFLARYPQSSLRASIERDLYAP